jgi:hypothetical protein
VVHASRLIEFGIQGSCGSWLGGSGIMSGSELGGSRARGSWGSGFKARVVHASRLIEFEVPGSCGSWLVGLGVRIGLGARRLGARGVQDPRLVWLASRLMEFEVPGSNSSTEELKHSCTEELYNSSSKAIKH